MALILPASYIDDAARSHGVNLAVMDHGTRLTYTELAAAVDREAARLVGDGAGPGTVVNVGAHAQPATLAAIWAAWRLGAAVRLGPAGDSRRRDGEVTLDTESQGEAGSATMAFIATSGSAGPRQVVRLTFANIAAAVSASQQRLKNGPGDVWLMCLPLEHVAAQSILWRSAAVAGAVFLQPRFDPEAVAALVRQGSVHWISMVPTMLHRLLSADPGPYNSALRGILLGGAAAAPGLVGRALEAGLPILSTYGMTETASQVATVAPGEEVESAGTVGRPLAGFEVSLARGSHGERTGEILVDGPAVSPGYVGGEPRTGPLHTGDLGYFDPAGRLIVLGRIDDLIVSGGEKVHPLEVEAVLLEHPAVDAAAVWGQPDEEWGQVVAATLVVSGTVDRAQLEQHTAARLERHKIPKRWDYADALPLLDNGKVDRRALAAGETAGPDPPRRPPGSRRR